MKKLSFFLMAMLFSVMSFAAEAKFDWSGITVTQSPTAANVYTQGDVTLTFEKASGSNIPAENKEGSIRMYKGTTLKIVVAGENNVITNIAFTCTSSSYAATNLQYNGEALPSNEWALTTPAADILLNAVANARFKSIVVTYGQVAADYIAAPAISGDVDFIESTEVSIAAGEGLKVYYTLDGTDPTNASPEYTASFEVKETTTVKAIAYNGENASEVTTQTFTKATQVTCAEAAVEAMKVASNNAPTALTYVVYGYVTEVIDQTLSSGQQRFWVADTKNGGQVLQSYYCNVPQVLKVGDYVQMFGKLTKYNTTPQMKNGQVTLAEEPVIEEPTIECKDALDFGAVVYTDEVEGQTLEVTGYNLTSNITVTLSDDVFAVDQTTLPAEGGELVVTPVSPLTVGTHTATLTLTSGEATVEVALTIVAKDVYTITWSVNGETSTTSVVEGDKLVLPTAPEAPEACSEKVFVGWTAAEEVDADGSDITGVTAATVPASNATYYAVFALQEGEGGVTATEVSVNIGNYATANSWVDATQYLSVTIDENITATATGGSNTGKYYNNGNNWRLYQNESPTLTIAATEGVTISTVAVTYTVNNTGVLTLGGANVESKAISEVNASSITFGVGNTGSAANGQVRITDIAVVYTSGAVATYSDYSTTCEDVVDPETPTALDKVEVSASAVKVIENGQLIVIKNGVKYNALGQEIK